MESLNAIRREPRYGYLPWWPTDGDDWIHPEDVSLVKQHIPSQRIWRCDDDAGDYMLLQYGTVNVRVRHNLWIEIPGEGLNVGDWVEVLSQMMKNEYRIGTICEMVWNTELEGVRYQIECSGDRIPKQYARSDLRPVDPIADEPAE